jgi:Leucine-rich repeat (LRR) protein
MKLLHCENNSIESINLSNCVNLTSLWCSGNDITTLDLSNNKNLSELSCNQNQLTSLDVSNNPLLKVLSCYDNQITSLDLSGNTALIDLYCKANALEWLNIKNGANEYLRTLHTKGNPNLYCIQVDDSAKASQTILHSLKDGYNYYYDYYWSIDDISTFSENCN